MVEDITYVHIPFVGKGNDEQRLIEGPISADVVDLDGQRVDQRWLKAALPAWFQYGNIRQQHDPKKPIGKARDLDVSHPEGPYIVAKIADPSAWDLIKEGVLSGFSIGIKNARVVHDGRAPKGTIVGGDVCEVSCVDHPSVRKAHFKLATKMAGGTDWMDHQSGVVITEDVEKAAEPQDNVMRVAEFLTKHISTEERKSLPDSRFAGPHRSFPINDADDVESAAHLIGHADHPKEVKQHIIELAEEEGNESALPESWKKDKKKMAAEDTEQVSKGLMKMEHDRGEGMEKAPDEEGEEGEPKEMKAADPETGKGALDFMQTMTAAPLHPSYVQPNQSGQNVAALPTSGPVMDEVGQRSTVGGKPFPYELNLKEVKIRLHQMMSLIDSCTDAGFNPNETHYSEPHGNPPTRGLGKPPAMPAQHLPNEAEAFGTTPASATAWHGKTSTEMLHRSADADAAPKILTEDDVRMIVKGVLDEYMDKLFSSEDMLFKSVEPDTPKSAFLGAVQTVAAEVADAAVTGIEERLERVEKAAAPSKGYTVAVEKQFNLNPIEKQVVEGDINKVVANMSEEDRTLAAAKLIHYTQTGRW